MPIHRLLTAAAAVSLIAGAAMAQTPAPAAAPAAAAGAKLAANGDSMTTLRTNADFSTLVKAIDGANLGGLFQDRARNLTLFAPTNAAFAALPAGQLDKMIADPTKADLRKLLLHHVVNAVVPEAKIKGTRGPWPSGAGDKIVLDGSAEGVMKADSANITQAVTTANGMIYVTDAILVAGSVPETLPQAAPEPAAAAAPAPAPEPAAKPAAKAPAKKKK